MARCGGWRLCINGGEERREGGQRSKRRMAAYASAEGHHCLALSQKPHMAVLHPQPRKRRPPAPAAPTSPSMRRSVDPAAARACAHVAMCTCGPQVDAGLGACETEAEEVSSKARHGKCVCRRGGGGGGGPYAWGAHMPHATCVSCPQAFEYHGFYERSHGVCSTCICRPWPWPSCIGTGMRMH